MSKTTTVSVILGALSYLMFLFVVVRKGLSYLFAVSTAPLLVIFPQLNSPDIGMGGLPLMLLGGVIGIGLFLMGIAGVLKLCKVPFAITPFLAGFFGLSVVVNAVNILLKGF
ncbi:MAG: hypothetical protein ACOY3M_02290 [Patescibacteria group bacterium]